MKLHDLFNQPQRSIVRGSIATGATTYTPDASKGKVFVINTSASGTLANPINMKDGEVIRLIFRITAATLTLTLGSKIKGSITLTTTANRTDVFDLQYDKTNDIYLLINKTQAITH